MCTEFEHIARAFGKLPNELRGYMLPTRDG